MKLVGVKKNIIEKLNGVKVAENHLIDYFCNVREEMKTFLPTQWVFEFTEIEMPAQDYDSVYRIPIEKNKEYIELVIKGHLVSATDILIFLGSEKGQEADYICPIFPFGASIEQQNDIIAKLLNKEQNENYEKKRNG